MWKIDQTQPGHRSFDLVGALNLLATSERRRLSALIPRVAFVLIAIAGVDELIAGTGGLPSYYSYFFVVLLMYAGLVLPLPMALGLTAIAVAGPSHRGLLFTQGLQNNESTVLLRPLALVVVVTLAWVVARVIRRNVSFYEQLYASIAAHFPNGTISLFDSSLRFLISGGEGLTKIGLTPDQVAGKGPWDIFNAQGIEAEVQAMQAALAGEASAFEMKFEGRDRLIRMTPVRDGSGKVVAGLSISQDITELRQAEATVRASEQRMFSLLESMPVGVFVLDAGGKPFYANAQAERLLGRGIVSATAVGELAEVYEAFVAHTNEPYPSSRMPIVRALAGEASMIEDMEIARPDGRIQLQVWGAPILDSEGNVAYTLVAFSNITAQKRFEDALRDSEARFRAVFEEGPLGMAIVSTEYRFLQVNQALCTLTGYSGDELVGRTFAEITHPDDRGLHLPQTRSLERGEFSVMGLEKRYIRKDGGIVWVRVTVAMVHDLAGNNAYFLSMTEDVSEQHRAREQIESMAYHDELTGLPNRRMMLDRLGQAIARSKRYGGGVILLSVDLDDLKGVNDAYGHAAGDALLVETARRLSAVVRDSDTAARMGGDEFLLLLTDAGDEDGAAVCRRIESSLARPVEYAGVDLFTRASIGRAALGEDGQDADGLIRSADAAMYRDKEAHRNPAQTR